MLVDRFGDTKSILQPSPHVTPEQQLLKALNAFGQRLDMLTTAVQAVANREIPAPQVTVKAPAAPNVTVDLDGVKDALTDAIRALPQDGLTADQVAAAFAQVLQQHKFEIDPDALKALAKARGGGGTISMPNLRDIQLRDASHELVNPARKEDVEAVTAAVEALPQTQGLTDEQLRATPVPVSGTVTATGPLTDGQLRATPVPVSGTVTATGPLTDTQLRAADVKVTLDGETVVLGAATAQVGSTIPDRPSEGPGRTMKSFQADAITADTTAYTVTGGKVLYITSWGGTIHNTSTVAMGHLRLRDGGAAGAIIASWTIPTAVAGGLAPNQRLFASFPEPKQFSTDVFLDVVAGTLTVCFQGTGYEE